MQNKLRIGQSLDNFSGLWATEVDPGCLVLGPGVIQGSENILVCCEFDKEMTGYGLWTRRFIKSVLTGESYSISQNQLTLGGGVFFRIKAPNARALRILKIIKYSHHSSLVFVIRLKKSDLSVSLKKQWHYWKVNHVGQIPTVLLSVTC